MSRSRDLTHPVKPARSDPVSPATDDFADMVRLTDPRAIRALAHPARLAVLDALNDDDKTLTATEAAQIAGLSPSAMSYHLRALAKWGIVRPADARAGTDGRERRWRRGGAGLIQETLLPGAESATAMIAARSLDLTRDKVIRFLHRSSSEGQFWQEHATLSYGELWMTEAEAEELSRTIREVVERSRRTRRTSRTHPAGARLVRTTFVVVPADEPPGPVQTPQLAKPRRKRS
jgi:DNA-binding transcriptional ArsR family regulator